jgi:hypothetical protein
MEQAHIQLKVSQHTTAAAHIKQLSCASNGSLAQLLKDISVRNSLKLKEMS